MTGILVQLLFYKTNVTKGRHLYQLNIFFLCCTIHHRCKITTLAWIKLVVHLIRKDLRQGK